MSRSAVPARPRLASPLRSWPAARPGRASAARAPRAPPRRPPGHRPRGAATMPVVGSAASVESAVTAATMVGAPCRRHGVPAARRAASAMTASAMRLGIVASDRPRQRRPCAVLLHHAGEPRCAPAASAWSASNGAPSPASARRATPDWLTASALAHQRRTGQDRQSGTRARQTVAPSSIIACVHVPGSVGIDERVGDGLQLDVARAWRAEQPADDAPDVRVDGRRPGTPKARAATAREVYGPTPGRPPGPATVSGTRPP